jgi:mercuric ion binding protein
MKKMIVGIAVAVMLSPVAALAKETSTTMKVSGWMCGGCPAKTEMALKKVDGVKSVAADKDKSTVDVTYDDAKVKQADLEKAIASSGFSVAK